MSLQVFATNKQNPLTTAALDQTVVFAAVLSGA